MFVGTRVSTLVPLAEFARNLILGTFIEMCRENGSLVKIGPQMKLLRHLLGIKLDKEKNQCIRKKKMGAQNIVKKIKQYQKKWLQHVQRMVTNIIPKQALLFFFLMFC